MNYSMTKILLLAALLLVIGGCGVSDPGSPLVNNPPETNITSAPQNGSTVNHYLNLFWSGNDGDGQVSGFNMFIDGELVAFTTRTDSAISFSAPSSGEVVSHTFKIQAVDNEGAADPTPPEIQFFTSNTGPTCFFSSDNIVRPNQNVGQGFSIKLEADDANRSGIWFALSLDDTVSWTEWTRDSIFLFADLDLDTFATGVVPLDNSVLTEGPHTLYARCRDSGFAVSEIVSRVVNVGLDHSPEMGEITVRYNSGSASDSLYPDGSIYHKVNAELVVAYEATAFAYRGLIHSYRYRAPDGVWSDWLAEPILIETDLPVGAYTYGFQGRDMAGVLSDTAEFFIRLVEQTFSDSILVVDETRNGPGGPGAPSDAEVDNFYAALLDSYDTKNIDMSVRSPGAYISPFDLVNVGLVVWHAEDRTDFIVDDNRRILAEYMQRGGRVIFSGWDIMSAFSSNAVSTYSGADFGYRYLRAFSSDRDINTTANPNAIREGTGFTGENGFPNVSIDPAKVLSSWNGAITRVWVFEPRGECTIIGRLNTITPTYTLANQVTAYYYDLSFRVAVFGVPLYFCQQPQVEALFDVLLPRIMTGL